MPAGPLASATSAPVVPPRPTARDTQAAGAPTPPSAPPMPERPWQRPAVLAAVIALHGLALAWLLRPPAPSPVTPPQAAPILVTLLAAEQPAAQPPTPPATPRPPKPTRVPAAVSPPRPAPVRHPIPAAEQPVATAPTAISELAPVSAPAPAPAPGPAEVAPPPSPPRYDAAYLHNQTPYPPLARRLRESGTVWLRVLVSAEGLPEKIELLASSGSSHLDEGAQQAVRQWRFIPARQGDHPVASYVVVPIIYKLEES